MRFAQGLVAARRGGGGGGGGGDEKCFEVTVDCELKDNIVGHL